VSYSDPPVPATSAEAVELREAQARLGVTPVPLHTRDGVFTWQVIKAWGAQWAAATKPRCAADSAGGDLPVSDGRAGLNTIALLCHTRGQALMKLQHRSRAAQWFLAALRLDPYCVASLTALLDAHMLSDDEESRLGAYLRSRVGGTTHASPPVGGSGRAQQAQATAAGARRPASSTRSTDSRGSSAAPPPAVPASGALARTRSARGAALSASSATPAAGGGGRGAAATVPRRPLSAAVGPAGGSSKPPSPPDSHAAPATPASAAAAASSAKPSRSQSFRLPTTSSRMRTSTAAAAAAAGGTPATAGATPAATPAARAHIPSVATALTRRPTSARLVAAAAAAASGTGGGGGGRTLTSSASMYVASPSSARRPSNSSSVTGAAATSAAPAHGGGAAEGGGGFDDSVADVIVDEEGAGGSGGNHHGHSDDGGDHPGAAAPALAHARSRTAASDGGGVGRSEEVLDLRWLLALYGCRLNRHSLAGGLALGARFQPLGPGGLLPALGGSLDVMSARAEALFAQHDIGGAYEATSRVMASDPHHRGAALVHFGALLGMGRGSELFTAAHAAVEAAPKG
jgi:hypothetical protein